MADGQKYRCSKCGRILDVKQFYSNRDNTPTALCKKCLTMHIDNFDESTYVWILKELDYPYIPSEWISLRDKYYAKDPRKMNGMSVFGRYISKMHLNQYKDYGYDDSQLLLDRENEKVQTRASDVIDPNFEQALKEQLEKGEISEAQYRTLTSTDLLHEEELEAERASWAATAIAVNPSEAKPGWSATPVTEEEIEADREARRKENQARWEDERSATESTYYDENNFMKEEDLPDPAANLSEEDKLYLVMKWGRLYKPNELLELERKYKEMEESFEVKDSDTIGTLILICKTYLKMNQAIDEGDLDSFQKLSRVYDTARKSAKFTAAQNKNKENSFLSSVGELVDYCEREGGAIPKFEINEPLDKVDKIINDLKAYNRSLIYSDTTLATQIEDYLKKKAILDEKRAEKELGTPEEDYVSDDDYIDFFTQQAEDAEDDEEVYNGE